jgi:AcrR family transcriptional regulator
VPRLWTDTLDEHRRAVRDATLDTAAALIAEHGLAGVTMSQLAERTGIGRATLYKYFPDVAAVLSAWHERQLTAHLTELRAATAATTDPATRLSTALDTYATLQRTAHTATTHGSSSHGGPGHGGSGHGGTGHGESGGDGPGGDLAALLHRSDHTREARAQLHTFLRDLIAESAAAGHTRADVPPAELATYCLHALTAAATLPTAAATRRLVAVTLAALSPEQPRA